MVGHERYATVDVDPPWPMKKIVRGVRPNQRGFDYHTMSVEDIAALDVGSRIADDAHVFLWTTQRFLHAAFHCLAAWGLTHRFTMVWFKRGGIQVWDYPQFNTEFVLVGSRGRPSFLDTKSFGTGFTGERRRHSQKPEEYYALLRRVTPAPRLAMFARRRIDGFDVWGDEAPRG